VSFIQTEEGKASLVSPNTQFTYTYDLKDYLGNVRASFDNQGTGGTVRIVQENNYYAFGLSQLYYDNSNGNRYLYNKKEQQLDLTNQYDYGARFYDPVIARWSTMDPLAEVSHYSSPYGYVKNNPITRVDPNGMIDVLGPMGTTIDVSRFDYKNFESNNVSFGAMNIAQQHLIKPNLLWQMHYLKAEQVQ
jgi:RHS repeat-associated protein